MLNKTDKNTIKIINAFKTVINKQKVADRLATETVKKGLREKNPVFVKFYGKNEPEFVTITCISFGLMQLIHEDFYIIKEVLGYDYVINVLNKSSRFLRIIK